MGSQAKLWEAEGLIDTSLYQQLADRYQFNTLISVKVDKTDHAVPVSLWVRDRNYRF